MIGVESADALTMLTDRDKDLLETLSIRVRILSLDQIARLWWTHAADPTRHARRRLRALEDRGFVEHRRFAAHPMLALDQPVFAWRPGHSAPDPDATSYALTSRWTELTKNVPVYVATQRTKGALGGGLARLSPLGHETHDLHVSELFVRLRLDQPDRAARWVGEEAFAKDRHDDKRPDALLVDHAGQPELVIEFAGKYSPDHVWSFHQDCADRELAYELW